MSVFVVSCWSVAPTGVYCHCLHSLAECGVRIVFPTAFGNPLARVGGERDVCQVCLPFETHRPTLPRAALLPADQRLMQFGVCCLYVLRFMAPHVICSVRRCVMIVSY